MRKDEDIEFTLVNLGKSTKNHVFTFMDLENQLKLHVSEMFYDCQISENVYFHAVNASVGNLNGT